MLRQEWDGKKVTVHLPGNLQNKLRRELIKQKLVEGVLWIGEHLPRINVISKARTVIKRRIRRIKYS